MMRLLAIFTVAVLAACQAPKAPLSPIETVQIDIAGLLFDVNTAGDPGATPVLLLHGFPLSAHSWRHQLPALAANGYFAMAPNQRGYSPGVRPSQVEAYAIELLVEDAIAVASHFGYEQFHLVGHDWGGTLAWEIAAKHSSRVLSLSVLSRPHPKAFLDAMHEGQDQAKRSGHQGFFQSEEATDWLLVDDAAQLRGLLRDQGVPDDDVAAYLNGLLTHDAMDAVINWYRARGPLTRTLPAIQIPTLYIWGNEDATVGRVAALATSEQIAAPYTFIELSGIGHFSTDQAPDAVNQALLRHLADHR
ncbi:MAG: alpha/beta hydrolase [Pseudomonadales bacterium]|jgi:pimeloyl-ACP methyl ester carboxylesterase|nr:alpha/beta hydrolase [Pseudomonadales bacterium]